ncbi:40S ribosomal protein S30 [Aphelenchoides fujianensis]|nr:40S ribosomal protein S30 [Aphelenchoides fujianensis]
MKLFINSVDGELHSLNVTPKTTVGQLKAELEVEDAVLTFSTKILDEQEATLDQLDIGELATLNCNARLLGGKVHGSLARAGKVRAQTPKVDKQEKKKKKRGRAFRRQQYNKRLTIKTDGPGRKRGPNSNAQS